MAVIEQLQWMTQHSRGRFRRQAKQKLSQQKTQTAWNAWRDQTLHCFAAKPGVFELFAQLSDEAMDTILGFLSRLNS